MLELGSLQDRELRNTLISLARQEISKACGQSSAPTETLLPSLEFEPINASGVFVSLHIGERLRGCIGKLRLDEVGPTELASAAVDAACSDPRFPPVTAHEVNELHIEISMLGPLLRCEPEQVVVGQHGLYIRSEDCSGLLLPQVAVERNWNREQFLEQLRNKAELGPARTSSEELWCFRAVVFDEDGNLRSY
ncbi:MAG: AmmeMemoRadiSam system protein A [Spirochaetaceae bacterium]|nr:MAG: AmmeMemoRadiSam system protein A [Spirochaetaceae bacterium]